MEVWLLVALWIVWGTAGEGCPTKGHGLCTHKGNPPHVRCVTYGGVSHLAVAGASQEFNAHGSSAHSS